MVKHVVEEVPDDVAIQLDLLLMINTEHTGDTVGAVGVRSKLGKE